MRFRREWDACKSNSELYAARLHRRTGVRENNSLHHVTVCREAKDEERMNKPSVSMGIPSVCFEISMSAMERKGKDAACELIKKMCEVSVDDVSGADV